MVELAKQNNIDPRKVVSIEAEVSTSRTISPGGGLGDVDNVIRIKEQADHPTVTCLRCPFDGDVMPPQFKLDPIIKPEAAWRCTRRTGLYTTSRSFRTATQYCSQTACRCGCRLSET